LTLSQTGTVEVDEGHKRRNLKGEIRLVARVIARSPVIDD